MKIQRLTIDHFRGFEHLEILPREHVFLVGQPGAGRSDLTEALWRVLSPDATRGLLVDDLDFHKRDCTQRIEVEAVLADLGDKLEQLFLDRLEFWDTDSDELVEEIGPEDEFEEGQLEHVLRICYRAEWDEDEQHARQWVDFPKFTDLDAGTIARVPRDLREKLPFTRIRASGQVLSLSSRGDLRRLIDAEGEGDLAPALEGLLAGIGDLAEGLHDSEDLSAVLDRVLAPLRIPLNLGERSAQDIIRFSPDGGSLAGVLRGLAPTVKLSDELGFLPLERHGSTLSGVFELSRAAAQTETSASVVVVDDFAEAVDPLAATHLAATLRAQASQLWLSTRNGGLGEVFRPEELIRLTISHEGNREAFSGPVPTSRAERAATRNLHLQLLPAATARAILVVEGTHDRAALQAAALRLHTTEGEPLLSARRIAIVDTGSTAPSGGIDAIPKLATFAGELGFFVIALIDWDRAEDDAQRRLHAVEDAADAVVRWPKGVAIERALIQGLSTKHLRRAVTNLSKATGVPLPFEPASEDGSDLERKAVKFVKSAGGLHSYFVDALPQGAFPSLIKTALLTVRGAVAQPGVHQL